MDTHLTLASEIYKFLDKRQFKVICSFTLLLVLKLIQPELVKEKLKLHLFVTRRL